MVAVPKSFLEYKQRLVYSLLRAAARVGLRLKLPLDQMTDLTRLAYFQEARERNGLELGQIAALFGKSLRTVATLHQQFRGDFFAPEQEVQLRREIAGHLNEGPHTLAEITTRFAPRTPIEIAAAVEDLVRQRVLIEDGERLRRNPEAHDFFSEGDIVARIDGLNRTMDVIAEGVFRRLVASTPDPAAVARSYVFAADPKRFQALLEDLLARLREDAIAADDAARKEGQPRLHAITLAATPMEDSQ
jgi:hypothetical protein